MKRTNIEFARELRKNSTWAERVLWKSLRNRGVGGARFRRQHSVGPYVLDFYCADRLLAIELDGDGHGVPHQRRHDEIRNTYLKAQQIDVLRFWNEDVRANLGGVIETILRMLETGKVPPHLNPLPDGERRPELNEKTNC